MRLSKDVLMNFYVHQTEGKMEENTILLYFFSVLVGRGGGRSQWHILKLKLEYKLWSIAMSTDYQMKKWNKLKVFICRWCKVWEREKWQPVKNALNQQRTVSTLQGLKIKEFLKQYGLHLGGSHRRFGSIDCTIRFTLKLIDAVALECECLTSVQHIFSTFPTWEKKHAEVIM